MNTKNIHSGLQPLIETIIKINSGHMTWNISEILDIFYMNIVRHRETLGYVNTYYICVPHELRGKKLMEYIIMRFTS